MKQAKFSGKFIVENIGSGSNYVLTDSENTKHTGDKNHANKLANLNKMKKKTLKKIS